MPHENHEINLQTQLSEFMMVVNLFGPIRPSPELNRLTQRAIKGHISGREIFTDITLHESRHPGGMRVEYKVTASSPEGAERAGSVYLSQLCDLLSTATRVPVWFYRPDEDSRIEQSRSYHRNASVDRILTESEWSWITGNVAYLRREHPRFLAAASWYRKGLLGRDALDDFCSYWRCIERLAYSYSDKSSWTEEERTKCPVRKCIEQLTAELFDKKSLPNVLGEPQALSGVIKLRNDLSHGNVPITLEVIDAATMWLKPLEHAAFKVLQRVQRMKLGCEIST